MGTAAVPAFALPVLREPRFASFTAFSRQVGTSFTLKTASGAAFPVVLEEARPYSLRNKPELADHRNFSLRFTGAANAPKEQETYAFHHPVLGRLDIFVVPNVCPATGRIKYQAAFYGAPLV